jgi:tetratricopeptide (TPR) repeat protein
MKRIGLGILLLLLVALTTYYYPKLQRAYEPSLRLHRLPPAFALKISSFGNKELMATLIFYNTEFYFGEKAGFRKETPELKLIYDALNKATDLDPRNMDCYYFAQGTLSWIKPAIPVLNKLLEKGFKHRPWDWYLPFFIGVNYYFQLKDPVHAAKYMKKAARLNPRSPVLATLAARMLYQGNQTQAGIIYLKSLIRETTNPLFRKKFEKRLHALEAIYFLERGIKRYEEKFGKSPLEIHDLMRTGIIRKTPVDPYGGMFYIGKDGRVYTTSKLAEGWSKDERHKDRKIRKSVPKRGS